MTITIATHGTEQKTSLKVSESPKKKIKHTTKFDFYSTKYLEGTDAAGTKARGPLCYQHFMLRAKALRELKLRQDLLLDRREALKRKKKPKFE